MIFLAFFLLNLLSSNTFGLTFKEANVNFLKNGGTCAANKVEIEITLPMETQCKSLVICYESSLDTSGMPKKHGKLSKRFHLTNMTGINGGMCSDCRDCDKAKKFHRIKLSEDKLKISGNSFTLDFDNLEVNTDSQLNGSFFADTNDKKELWQLFALDLLASNAKRVFVWEDEECGLVYEDEKPEPNVHDPGDPKRKPRPSRDTNGNDDSNKFTDAVELPISDESTSTSIPLTTTTEEPIPEPILLEQQIVRRLGIGNGFNQKELHKVLLLKGTLERRFGSLLVNLCPTKEECNQNDDGRIFLQFGLAFGENGTRECWMNSFKDSAWLSPNVICNSTLFEAGKKFEIVLDMHKIERHTDGFSVWFGAIPIGTYNSSWQKSRIDLKGGYFVQLYGNIVPPLNATSWAVPATATYREGSNLGVIFPPENYRTLETHNLQILGHVPMHAKLLQFLFQDNVFGSGGSMWNIANIKVDVEHKNVTMRRIMKLEENQDMHPVPGQLPFGFYEGEDMDFRFMKKSCQQYWIWHIWMNDQMYELNASTNRSLRIQQAQKIWAKFRRFHIKGDFLFYDYNFLPPPNPRCLLGVPNRSPERCVPKDQCPEP